MELANTAAEKMLRGINDVISFPEVAFRVSQMVKDESYDARQIAAEIESAPDIAASILRLANCAVFAFPKKVESIHRAVALVGNKAVRDIVFAISAKSAFAKADNKIMTLDLFWRHSVRCAAISKELAKRIRGLDREALFTAGLLHDIGQLVLFRQDPETAKKAIEESQKDPNLACHELEEQYLGFHHGTLGGLLADRWQFPEKLIACIAFHHQPFLAPDDYRQEARVVHAANALATLLDVESEDLADAGPMYPGVLQELGFEDQDVHDILYDARDATGELMQVFSLAA